MAHISVPAFGAGLALLILTACAEAPDPQTSELPDMGNFQLHHNLAKASDGKVVPPSRSADPEVWERILIEEVEGRFGAYEGGRDFHLFLVLDAYSLAPPGVPILLSPKSVLVVSVNLWDDKLRRRIHDEPHQITVFEGGGDALIGSGLTRSAEEQMRVLARNAVFEVQKWMLRQPAWFDLPPLAE